MSKAAGFHSHGRVTPKVPLLLLLLVVGLQGPSGLLALEGAEPRRHQNNAGWSAAMLEVCDQDDLIYMMHMTAWCCHGLAIRALTP